MICSKCCNEKVYIKLVNDEIEYHCKKCNEKAELISVLCFSDLQDMYTVF